MNRLNRRRSDFRLPPAMFWRLLFAAALLALALLNQSRAAEPTSPPCPCASAEQGFHGSASAVQELATSPPSPSWMFRRGRYTHDPATGDRVAQYDRIQPIEPLDDPRRFTSGYARQRTVLRGPDGSVDTYYRVQSYGSGNGGFEAQQERHIDAARGAYGGVYGNVNGGYGYGGFPPFAVPPYGAPLHGNPYYGGWWGAPRWGAPTFAYPPGHSYGWGAGPPGGPRGGPGYATPYGPVLGDAAEGYDSRAWNSPDRDFYQQPPTGSP